MTSSNSLASALPAGKANQGGLIERGTFKSSFVSGFELSPSPSSDEEEEIRGEPFEARLDRLLLDEHGEADIKEGAITMEDTARDLIGHLDPDVCLVRESRTIRKVFFYIFFFSLRFSSSRIGTAVERDLDAIADCLIFMQSASSHAMAILVEVAGDCKDDESANNGDG